MTYLSFPYLSGKLINLRELTMDDATTIVNLMDDKIAKYLYQVPYPYRLEDALNFIKSSYEDFKFCKAITFAIDYKNKSKSILLLGGTIGIKDIDYVNNKADIGYWIGKQYQGKGIATECIKLVVNYGFDALKLEEILAYVFPDNNSSIRVLKKNGFEKTKEIVNEYHPISKRYKNSLVYIIKNKMSISS
jgi:[ribosomal protein S5]-alanine N-acetyltransferase